jgi:hypothetical protein
LESKDSEKVGIKSCDQYFKLFLDDRLVYGLLDDNYDTNLVSLAFAEKMHIFSGHPADFRDTSNSFYTNRHSHQEPLFLVGHTDKTLSITIPGLSTKFPFQAKIVDNLQCDLLLGRPFLVHHGVKCDIQAQGCTIQNKFIPCINDATLNNKTGVHPTFMQQRVASLAALLYSLQDEGTPKTFGSPDSVNVGAQHASLLKTHVAFSNCPKDPYITEGHQDNKVLPPAQPTQPLTTDQVLQICHIRHPQLDQILEQFVYSDTLGYDSPCRNFKYRKRSS